jgi:hypothetical protein
VIAPEQLQRIFETVDTNALGKVNVSTTFDKLLLAYCLLWSARTECKSAPESVEIALASTRILMSEEAGIKL